jgi:hypothetical protein
LATALAYEAIFQKPVRELFAGLYQQIEKKVAARAKTLTYRTQPAKPNRRNLRKRESIKNVAALQLKNKGKKLKND